MDVRGIIVRFPTRYRNLSLLQSVQKGSEVHLLSTKEISGDSYPREETPGCKTDHSPPLIATIKNNISHITTNTASPAAGNFALCLNRIALKETLVCSS